MRLIALLLAACLLLGGCPKAPSAAEKAPLTMEQQVSNDAFVCWETTDVGRRGYTALMAVGIVELRKQTAEMERQTALLQEIAVNTRRTP